MAKFTLMSFLRCTSFVLIITMFVSAQIVNAHYEQMHSGKVRFRVVLTF